MPTSKRRLKFKCWHCERDYEMTRQDLGLVRLVVECPFCEHEAVVDLAPFRDESVSTFKSVDGEPQSNFESLNLPAVLPTSPPEPEDSSSEPSQME